MTKILRTQQNEMSIPEETAPLKYAVGIDATLLKTKVGAFVQGGDGTTKMLVLPTTAEETQKLSLDEILTEVETQFQVSKESVNKAIDGIQTIFPAFDPNQITFELNQIFFYYCKEKPKTPEEKDTEEATTEYAFSIKINLGSFLSLAGIISVQTLYLALWNTERKGVLEKFNMADLNNLLPA